MMRVLDEDALGAEVPEDTEDMEDAPGVEEALDEAEVAGMLEPEDTDGYAGEVYQRSSCSERKTRERSTRRNQAGRGGCWSRWQRRC
ncbi:hypothetical protein SCP_1004990 [Sparassis crispa]|uniref:Uncharacterized protein n=1 Tax=Sparassis crispa TaxID=139825 RepID=A0A401GYM0_9APHY|nr:hypothetical protein SCP_1004990 [Sparassis crispa]GBE87252.1 hypothetical protein SCP_1004990 [Sparassis crispa]